MKRPLDFSHDFLKAVLTKDSIALDATMGNGHDTLFLAGLAQKVYAFDIQEKALRNTQKRLAQAGATNVELILDGHEQLDQYVKEPLDAIVFNLGYLPNAEKSLVTKPETTLQAMTKALDALKPKGRMAIMVYYGHPGGLKEKNAVIDLVTQLDQNHYTVMIYQAINQVNTPPFLIMIEKHTAP